MNIRPAFSAFLNPLLNWMISTGGIDNFLENKHFVFFAPIARFLLGHSRTMEMLVPKRHNLETATVDVEMNVAFLKIGCDGFPYTNLSMEFLHGFPCILSDALAVDIR